MTPDGSRRVRPLCSVCQAWPLEPGALAVRCLTGVYAFYLTPLVVEGGLGLRTAHRSIWRRIVELLRDLRFRLDLDLNVRRLRRRMRERDFNHNLDFRHAAIVAQRKRPSPLFCELLRSAKQIASRSLPEPCLCGRRLQEEFVGMACSK